MNVDRILTFEQLNQFIILFMSGPRVSISEKVEIYLDESAG